MWLALLGLLLLVVLGVSLGRAIGRSDSEDIARINRSGRDPDT
jgi:hypothetical protein